MSFESYVKSKLSEKQAASEFRTKKKAVKKDDNIEVTINIGLKRFDEEDLKTIRGKRLPVRVPQNASYGTVLEKAVSKWGAFDRRFDADKEYVLLYKDGTQAVFMPGTSHLLSQYFIYIIPTSLFRGCPLIRGFNKNILYHRFLYTK